MHVNDGSSSPHKKVTMSIPSLYGGSADQVLTKNSGTNYDFAWKTKNFVPSGGNTGDVLTKDANGYGWATPSGGGDSIYNFPTSFQVNNGSINDSNISFQTDSYLNNLWFSYQGSKVTCSHFKPQNWPLHATVNRQTANFSVTVSLSGLSDFPSIDNGENNYIAKGTCYVQSSNNKCTGVGQYSIYVNNNNLIIKISNLLPVYNSTNAIAAGNVYLQFA
jgi:hypothetical protein